MSKVDRSELRWVLIWAVLIVLLASVPYVYGVWLTPPGYTFLGLTHNIDDGAVYLSWMRQAADGHFFERNLFTNEPQPARQFNVLFLVMGWFAAITHLPLIIVFHLFRIVLGIAMILCIWRFSMLFLDDPNQRKLLIPLVGLSAGIGWLIPNAKMPTGSVDVWQPEAITFLSIYLNPLFLAGLLLMLGALYWLELARREGKPRCAVYAGLHLLVLGNVHTYDVLTVSCIWTAYLIVLVGTERRIPTRTIGLSGLAAVIAAPSVGYQFWVYSIDPIFAARVNTEIASPLVWSFFEGYGVILIGALVGAAVLIAGHRFSERSPLLLVWSVVGFAIPYIPIAQQRKLVMGLHIPLCMLCAYALSRLLPRLPGTLGRTVFVAILVVAAGSNARFLATDMGMLAVGDTAPHYAPYIHESEMSAMIYLRDHATARDCILAPPTFALFLPAFTGRQVYYGHWSETPDYAGRRARWTSLGLEWTGPGYWMSVIRESGATYYVSEDRGFDPPEPLEHFFSKCLEAGRVRVYRVHADIAGGSLPR